MPTGQVYAKAIENINVISSGGTFPYINISFDVKENFNSSDATFDSNNTYSYYLPITETSMTLVINNSTGNTDLFEVTSGKVQISFANEEYYDITNDTTLNVSAVYTAVQAVLLS